MSEPGVSPAALLAAQRAAFLRDGPPALQRRRADLKALRGAIVERRRQIEAVLSADFGHRSRHETAILELLTLVQGIDYLHRHVRRWMRPHERRVAWQLRPGRAYVVHQPVGVVGILSPWNYPLSLALMPLATALAAGNRAMLKPSEATPATAGLIAGMLSELYPPEQVATVTGDAAVGAAFSALPFDHLVFTGSTAVGRRVMQAASTHLVPLTLELGGKSPAILGPAGDPVRAAAGIAYGKLANAGQTCIAPDYVLAPAGRIEAFVAAYDQAVRTLYPAGPATDGYTAIISEAHHERLRSLLQDAREHGARVREVGNHPEAARQRPRTLAPSVVLDATPHMRVLQEEIFGPVLPVVAYDGIDQAIAYVNARPRPLALYYFGPEDGACRQVLAHTISGNVTVNDTLLHYAQDDLPFGGVGASGMGAYHGFEGFRSLSHAKGVFVQGRWNAARLLRPPYGRLAERIIRLMLR